MNFFQDVKVKEINILLLGETGAGKSTTINALANYMKYPSFADASDEEFLDLIPCKFTLGDDDGKMIPICSSKSDPNERMVSGKSSTKDPKPYLFKHKSCQVRLIDTPGIGDTDGIDTDMENLDKILSYLHMLDKLHGICILIKATETRMTDFFKYCITELLSQLHKSACQNIVFCFTFSRNSHYRPGDAFFTLKNFLQKDLPEVKVDLKPNVNCFFIDNEAYRFLLAKKANYSFPPGQINDYQISWDRSVNQTDKMLNLIANIPPHDLENTISLNKTRKFIYQMAEPIVEISAQIKANIDHIKNKENELQDVTKNKMDLAQNLNVDIDDLVATQLPYPATVCSADECTDVINTDRGPQINYKTRCHPHCYLTGVTVNVIGHPILKDCAAMTGTDCHECGCSYEVHKHVVYEYAVVKKSVINVNQQRKIDNEQDAIDQINDVLQQTKQINQELTDEINTIQEISAKFAYILIEHSTTPYNKFLEPYLELLIREEKKKMSSCKGYSKSKLDILENLLQTHKEQVKILVKAINSKSRDPVSIQEMGDLEQQLFGLKNSGPQFKKIFNLTNSSTLNNITNSDITINL